MTAPAASDLIIGIDLGTTHSLVGVVDSGFPILLADAEGRRLLPSAVHYPADGSAPLTGAAALRMRAVDPERTVVSVKRLMGRRFDELSPAELSELGYPVAPARGGWASLRLPSAGRDRLLPEEVSAEILRALKQRAEAALDLAPGAISRAVITVPAYFNDGQRNATKRAGERAGIKVERILNEPTAAALAYGLDKLDEHSRVAVFDFGGGTFDLSLLELREGVFEVIATDGDTRLGGDDLDAALSAHLKTVLALPDPLDPVQSAQLLAEARRAKEALSDRDSTEIRLPFFQDGRSHSLTLQRSAFEEIARPIIERTRPHCLRVLAAAGLLPEFGPTRSDRPSDPVGLPRGLDRVILVGGSTRIPLVRRCAAEWFGLEPDVSQHPDEAVALGAVIQAGILGGNLRQLVLLDVTPLSLGIETFGGLMNVIIPRNTTLPAKAGELFTNALPHQESMLVRVLQGEREMARDNWELGCLSIAFPPGPKGSARVGVQFSIDADGILTVLARDTVSHTERLLEIRDAAVDVDDARVEAMIAESVEHAFEDMNERVWTEARLKGEELLAAVDLALARAGDAIDAAEAGRIRRAADAVRSALADPAKAAAVLKEANRSLDEATESLAAILVERALEKALGGRLE